MTKQAKKPWTTYLQIPKRPVNDQYPYHFKLYDWKTDGMVFLTTALFIPFVFLFIFRFALGMSTDNPVIEESYLLLIYLAITLISALAGFYLFYQRDKQLFLKSGTFVFYCFILVPNAVSFVVTLIAALAGMTNDSPVAPFLGIWTQILSELIVLWLAFKYTNGLKNRIITTIKENWLILLITVVISTGIFFAVVTELYQVIFKNTPLALGESNNQNSLEDGLANKNNLVYRVFFAISLFVLTVLVAPITEEIATRNAWFAGVGNQTIGLITTALFFGMLHTQTGDVEHMLNYVLAGLLLGGVFLICRGNVTYDWLTHAAYNLIVLIIMLCNNF